MADPEYIERLQALATEEFNSQRMPGDLARLLVAIEAEFKPKERSRTDRERVLQLIRENVAAVSRPSAQP